MDFLSGKLHILCSEYTCFLSEIRPAAASKTTSTQNINEKQEDEIALCKEEEDEIALCKRHKKYFKDAEKISLAASLRNREHDSLEVTRDMYLFMSRYTITGQFVSTCNACTSPLPWQKYRCIDCFDLDLCAACYLSGTRPFGHLHSHKTIELR